MPINTDEIKVWSSLIYNLCGICLDETKGYLLESRLGNLLNETNSQTFSELYFKVKADGANVLRRKVIDVLTTGETSFFRDTSPFDLLRNKILPELIDRRKKGLTTVLPVPIRIWSAACSTGQEVYTIAMVVREMIQGSPLKIDVQITGTDISDQALAKASSGVYTRFEVERGLPLDKAKKCFTQQGDNFKINDEIRSMASFQRINLMDPFDFGNKFDIIFCRNVAIYFQEKDKKILFERLGRALAADGALIIGSTESISGLGLNFVPQRYLRTVFYQPGKPGEVGHL
ncbi:MAG: protein-glutamate O-methyltransferase CheR [Candidatus Riflebacteria bacterium]|nr:protein-glutamate O-methyltransferase CheR [Candidatus Riflebacteria bacterium]